MVGAPTEQKTNITHDLFLKKRVYNYIKSVLTVWILGRNLVGDLRGITDSNRVNGTNPYNIIFLWFDSVINPELQLFNGSVVDPEPLQLWASLCHLNMVASYCTAPIFGWRFPGDVDVLSAGVNNSQFKRRRWGTWRETTQVPKYKLKVGVICLQGRLELAIWI